MYVNDNEALTPRNGPQEGRGDGRGPGRGRGRDFAANRGMVANGEGRQGMDGGRHGGRDDRYFHGGGGGRHRGGGGRNENARCRNWAELSTQPKEDLIVSLNHPLLDVVEYTKVMAANGIYMCNYSSAERIIFFSLIPYLNENTHIIDTPLTPTSKSDPVLYNSDRVRDLYYNASNSMLSSENGFHAVSCIDSSNSGIFSLHMNNWRDKLEEHYHIHVDAHAIAKECYDHPVKTTIKDEVVLYYSSMNGATKATLLNVENGENAVNNAIVLTLCKNKFRENSPWAWFFDNAQNKSSFQMCVLKGELQDSFWFPSSQVYSESQDDDDERAPYSYKIVPYKDYDVPPVQEIAEKKHSVYVSDDYFARHACIDNYYLVHALDMNEESKQILSGQCHTNVIRCDITKNFALGKRNPKKEHYMSRNADHDGFIMVEQGPDFFFPGTWYLINSNCPGLLQHCKFILSNKDEIANRVRLESQVNRTIIKSEILSTPGTKSGMFKSPKLRYRREDARIARDAFDNETPGGSLDQINDYLVNGTNRYELVLHDKRPLVFFRDTYIGKLETVSKTIDDIDALTSEFDEKVPSTLSTVFDEKIPAPGMPRANDKDGDGEDKESTDNSILMNVLQEMFTLVRVMKADAHAVVPFKSKIVWDNLHNNGANANILNRAFFDDTRRVSVETKDVIDTSQIIGYLNIDPTSFIYLAKRLKNEPDNAWTQKWLKSYHDHEGDLETTS